MSELQTIYDCERAKFNGFGTYKLPIEERVNEIMEITKKEYPTIDNYLLWVCAVDYVLEEKGLKKKMRMVFEPYFSRPVRELIFK